MTPKKFAKRLKAFKKAYGYTWDELAEYMGFHRETVRRWGRGSGGHAPFDVYLFSERSGIPVSEISRWLI